MNERVKKARMTKGWSRARLAREAGISDRTVERAEKGLPINELSQSKIAQALGMETGDLFE